MEKQWIRVIKKKLIEPGLTCGLCGNLLNDATGNTECIHTFCRECIYSVIEEEELDCCPVCETDWGISPVQKMRPDHHLQSLRNTIFPSGQSAPKGKEKSPSPSPLPLAVIYPNNSVPSPSSPSPLPLAVIHPTVATAGHWESSIVSIEKPIENDQEELLLLEYHHQDGSRSSHDDTAIISSENSEQTGDTIRLLPLSSSEATLPLSEDSHSSLEVTKNGADQPQVARLELRVKPLNSCEGTSTISLKSNNAKGKAKLLLERMKVNESDSPQVQKSKNKGKEKVKVKKNSSTTGGGGSSRSRQEVLGAIATNNKILRNDNIWLNLIASEHQEGAPPLPQVPSPYLRIKDGSSMTISIIQKYLKQKLGLEREDEIEIKCMGKSVHPAMEVRDLLQSWVATKFTKQKIKVTLGSSAKDFLMPLTYGRKVLNP